jgi:hypothetical protein
VESTEWAVFVMVALVFYIPAHILPPVLLTFLYSQADKEGRRKQALRVVIDCLLTIVITALIVGWRWQAFDELLMWPFMLALFPPYIRIWKLKRQAAG